MNKWSLRLTALCFKGNENNKQSKMIYEAIGNSFGKIVLGIIEIGIWYLFQTTFFPVIMLLINSSIILLLLAHHDTSSYPDRLTMLSIFHSFYSPFSYSINNTNSRIIRTV